MHRATVEASGALLERLMRAVAPEAMAVPIGRKLELFLGGEPGGRLSRDRGSLGRLPT
jgi:hypothetical protein